MSIFSSIRLARPKHSTFNLSHEAKFTGEIGHLVPAYWTYLEPSCKFRAKAEVQMRLAPMLAPIMHRLNIRFYWFKVPIRILMNEEDFHGFFTDGADGTSNVEWPKYRFDASNLNPLSQSFAFDPLSTKLADYLGFPTRHVLDTSPLSEEFTIDAMPFRAYASLWNNYFRDPNVSNEVVIDKFVGTQAAVAADADLFAIKNKCWEKDYFTSALPWPQRGVDMNMPFTAVSDLAMDGDSALPTLAKVIPNPSAPEAHPIASPFLENESLAILPDGDGKYTSIQAGYDADNDLAHTLQYDITPHTTVNTAIQGTINQLREAFSIQRWRERMAVGGARYIEQINSMFGVRADDGRLQRPMYLGGCRVPLQISEVLQTSESTETSAQGVPAGRGYTLDKAGYVNTYTREHCIIMCLMCVEPKPGYYQGMPRKCDIRDKFDFAWPILGHLGEQEIRKGELVWSPKKLDQVTNDETFGYQSRYAQWKYEPNRVHGQFKSTLEFWHLARKFANVPSLNKEFTEIRDNNDDLNRVFAVMGNDSIYGGVTDHLWWQMAFDIRVKRPLPYFGTPR